MVKSGCAAVVVFNGNDVGAIIVDINVEAIFSVPLEASTGGIGFNRLQCSSEANASVCIEILVEICFTFGDSTPCLLYTSPSPRD